MKLFRAFLLTLFIPTFIGVSVMLTVSIVPFFTEINTWLGPAEIFSSDTENEAVDAAVSALVRHRMRMTTTSRRSCTVIEDAVQIALD